jgi:hypothetical protein
MRPIALLLAICLLTSSACTRTAADRQAKATSAASTPAQSISGRRFDRTLLLETEPSTSANVSIGDVNGDGLVDLVLAKGRHDPVIDRVLLTDGHGHITSAYDLRDTPDRTYTARLVDLNGDGHLDIVSCNDAPDPKLIYLNDGHGQFHVEGSFGQGGWSTRNCGVADLNGDGRPDIIVANRAGTAGADYVCLNTGAGRFDGCRELARMPSTTITPADFTHDGLIDLAVPYRDRGQSYVYVNAGNSTFPADRRIPFGPPDATIRMADAADLDGDGELDIVAIDESKGVAAYFGQKGGGFSAALQIADGKVAPYALAAGDLNGDGKTDMVVGHVDAAPAIYFNTGDGRHFSRLQFGDDQGTAYGFAIADVDGDGLPDIAMARSGAPNILYFADRVDRD